MNQILPWLIKPMQFSSHQNKEKPMKTPTRKQRFTLITTLVLAFSGVSTMLYADDIKVDLAGKNEVPPVTTTASGSGTITINSDKSVSGNVRTTGVAGTMAHIHSGHTGQTGPVIIPLSKTADNVWSVPAGAKLSDAAYKDFEAGNLYVNVHSKAYPEGEIRGQIASPSGMKGQTKDAGGGGY